MKFYHFVPVNALQSLMRGNKIGAVPGTPAPDTPVLTLCPASDLIDYGILTLYCQYERPLVFRLGQAVSADPDELPGDPRNFEYLKLNFEEERGKNRFTLGLLTPKERQQFLRDQKPPKGESLVLTIPKAWEHKQNRTLRGGTITLVLYELVTLFRNNLMQVIDARKPHNTQLYPDGRSKLEAAKNIHAYAQLYVREYQKRLDRVLKDPGNNFGNTVINLMDANTLAEFKREKVLVLTLKAITNLLGGLVDFYQKNQVSRDLEQQIVSQVSALPASKLKYIYF